MLEFLALSCRQITFISTIIEFMDYLLFSHESCVITYCTAPCTRKHNVITVKELLLHSKSFLKTASARDKIIVTHAVSWFYHNFDVDNNLFITNQKPQPATKQVQASSLFNARSEVHVNLRFH